MPVTAWFLKGVRVILEYGMLLWLLWFTVKLAKGLLGAVRRQKADLRPPETSPAEAVLSVEEAPEKELKGKRFAFREQIAIGRGPDNHIIIPEGYVSHHHAVIYRHGNQYVIEDLGSVNHTYVNGKVLKGKAYVRPGDKIRIGLVTLQFER